MTTMDFLEVFGSIRDSYILEAKNGGQSPKQPKAEKGLKEKDQQPLTLVPTEEQYPYQARKNEKRKKKGFKKFLILSAAVALLLATLAGRGYFTQWIEYFSTFLEKTQEQNQYADPTEETTGETTQETQTEPGFTMEFESTYQMTQENGVYYLRPIQEVTPACEMEIRELPNRQPMELAQETRDQMVGNWETVSYILQGREDSWTYFSAQNGTAWDSPIEYHYFRKNGEQGTYHIIIRYFLEAAEGHGMHFQRILTTFEPKANGIGDQNAIVEAARQEVEKAKGESEQITNTLMTDGSLTQSDMNTLAGQRHTLWLETLEKLWTALEQTQDQETLQAIFAEQMNWSAEKKVLMEQKAAELDGGSMTGLVVNDAAATMAQERADTLLRYLEGTAALPQTNENALADPETVANQFTEAYLQNDTSWMAQYLSANLAVNFSQDVLGYENPDGLESYTLKGMDNIVSNMAQNGEVSAIVELRDSENLKYLSITLVWENGQWKVSDYGLNNQSNTAQENAALLSHILSGNSAFTDSQGTIMSISDYCQYFSERSQVAVTIPEFCIVDLEQDHIPEVILRIYTGASDYGVLVLHREEDGSIRGYEFSYRQMYEIKADGTFVWSNSASNSGTATIDFAQGQTKYSYQFWSEERDGQVRCMQNGSKITREEFDALWDAQSSKPAPQWVAYPAENYEMLFS